MAAVIHRQVLVEDLISQHPGAVGLLIEEGLPCVVCGEPYWGSLAELAEQHGWSDAQVTRLLAKLNHLAASH